uniref:NADH-ubiquinone oxidoreductase chain 3 n=1 Tax=Lasioglossum laevigatum TaxID=88530 RepID=A0A0S2LTG7_9HYME|nr:NADH dehydrogenase subunit 3 [Lasioglossum laevigatum]
MIYNIIMATLISLLIPLMIILINFFLSMTLKKDREKITPFECGFDPITSARLPFSIQFYIMTLMFLIFDVEIILILPILKLLNNLSLLSIFTFLTFLLMLIFSLWIEWFCNLFKWIH